MSGATAKVRIAGCTDTGMRRQINEDHIGFDQNLGIAVLADGMGGHQSGEIASHMAVEFVMENLQELMDGESAGAITGSQLLEKVSNTISYSNTKIFSAAAKLEQHKGMGTTVVAAIVQGKQLYVGHVGDSRLYLFRSRDLQRITRDHSLVQDLIDRGFYTEEEARQANVGHIVTRALGTKEEVEVDTEQHDLEEGDIFLLCSDGLSDMVDDWKIEEMLREGKEELQTIAQALVDTANRNGGKDNISVILMQILIQPAQA